MPHERRRGAHDRVRRRPRAAGPARAPRAARPGTRPPQPAAGLISQQAASAVVDRGAGLPVGRLLLRGAALGGRAAGWPRPPAGSAAGSAVLRPAAHAHGRDAAAHLQLEHERAVRARAAGSRRTVVFGRFGAGGTSSVVRRLRLPPGAPLLTPPAELLTPPGVARIGAMHAGAARRALAAVEGAGAGGACQSRAGAARQRARAALAHRAEQLAARHDLPRVQRGGPLSSGPLSSELPPSS